MLTLYISGKGYLTPFKRICLGITLDTGPKTLAKLIKGIKDSPEQFFMAKVDKVTVVNQQPAVMDIAVNKTIKMSKPRRVK